MENPAPIAASDVLRMFTIYCCPLDYPAEYVVRGHSIVRGNPEPVMDAELTDRGPSLESVREPLIARGLHRIPRAVTDDPKIVETWL